MKKTLPPRSTPYVQRPGRSSQSMSSAIGRGHRGAQARGARSAHHARLAGCLSGTPLSAFPERQLRWEEGPGRAPGPC